MFEKKIIEPQSYLQQFKDFISTTEYTEIDIKDLLLKILDTLNEADLKNLVNFVEDKHPKLFGGLVEQLENMAINNKHYGKILGKDFKLLETLKKEISYSNRTHNAEMHTALLTGMLVNYGKSDNRILKILYRSIISLLHESLLQNHYLLRSKIEFGQYLSIESALCIFFL